MFRNLTALVYGLLFFALPDRAAACGFDYIGDCSTAIFLDINGTRDSFYVAQCPFGIQFDGLALGNIRTLRLPKVKGATWESCQNNVAAMQLRYRIFPTAGMPGGAWQTVDLPEIYNTLEGPYTTRFRAAEPDLDLLAGLNVGVNYTLEVYFRVEVDTIGDDFVPEMEFLQNNAGQNFRITFTPGGPAAPPFTVVVTHDEDVKCAADATGRAGVEVFGDQAGLFYDWGNGNNFFEQFNLAVGTYTVTVSGASGHTQTASIEITAQSNLQNQMTALVPIGCDGSPGSATAVVSGGVEPYKFQWSTGDSTATAQMPFPDLWWLLVTDSIGCTGEYFVEIPIATPPQITLADTICHGEIFTWNGMTFSAPGVYLFDLPGFWCDTTVELTLHEVLPPTGSGLGFDTLNCNDAGIGIWFQATVSDPNAQLTWTGPKNWTASGPTVFFEGDFPQPSPGEFGLQATNSAGCTAQLPVNFFIIKAVLLPLNPSDFTVVKASGPAQADGSASIELLPGFTCQWSNGATTPTASGLLPGNYCVTMTDSTGVCGTSGCVDVGFTVGTDDVFGQSSLRLSPNPAGDFVKVEFGAANFAPAQVAWQLVELTGRTLRQGQAEPVGGAFFVKMEDLSPGTYCLKINALGRTAVARVVKI